jgi:wyosine [tRNA(Phe)-imidazoG37] synthetase (radical SAM superfamily)
VSKKQCNFDCLYCELKGAKVVNAQDEVSSVDSIYNEIKEYIDTKGVDFDVLTLTANGEPTLYPYIDELIDKINSIKKGFKLLILSNGANIYKKEIQNILKKIDIVKLSLDSVNQNSFKKIDRAKDIKVSDIVDGMVEFQKSFKNELIIEVLFVEGVNDSDEDIAMLNTTLQKINPTRVDIGTIDRPPAYDVKAISNDRLVEIAKMFDNLNINIALRKSDQTTKRYYSKEDILNTIELRPFSKGDVEALFCDKSKQNLKELIENDLIFTKKVVNVEFYKKKP